MKKDVLLLILIVALGAFFRLYGLNWDQGQHLHPDERFLTMVTTDTTWPQNIYQYLDQQTSPLNPRNHNFNFFVYGLFPITFVKFVADFSQNSGYEGYTFIGRFLSAFLDLVTIFMVYKIAELFRSSPGKNSRGLNLPSSFSLVASLFYALAVLPVQLSHFYTVDLFVVTALTASFYFLSKFVLIKKRWVYVVLMGILTGIALASKISSVLFIPFVLVGIGLSPFLNRSFKKMLQNLLKPNRWWQAIRFVVIFIVCTYFALRISDPYMFASSNIFNAALNPSFLSNVKELQSWSDPDTHFPPAVQWISTTPLLFPLQNMFFYGMGIPFGLLFITSFITFPFFLYRFGRHETTLSILLMLFLLWLWIGLVFAYQGVQFAKTIRYFVPLYPFAAILTSLVISTVLNKRMFSQSAKYILALVCATIVVWPVSFMSIYSYKHTRIQASEFIYQTVPQGAKLGCEHWDDCMPLSVEKDNQIFSHTWYHLETLPLYGDDSPEKWQELNQTLASLDYIILSSNRLYGAITSVPQRYPQSTEYYRKLFDGSLGFTKVAEFTSRPTFPLPIPAVCLHFPDNGYGLVAQATEECEGYGIQIVDDYADESFTVYDHPKITIFRNEHFNQNQKF